MNVEKIRKDFPVLERQVRGRPLIYLDNAATSQKPQVVLDALADYYRRYNANIHRGIHALAEEATQAYEDARRRVAAFIGASDPACVIFTRNTTESVNLAAHAWGRKFLKEGDEIVLTELEHHSNLVPWQICARATGAALKFIDLTPDLRLDMDSARRAIGPKTKLVCLTHVSNGVGTVNPVEEIALLARAAGAKFFVDGAQAAPHRPVNVEKIGCDFYAFSAHKMCGPTGIGVLWVRRDILETMDPFLGGGDMIREVWKDRATWNEIPWKYEAGTPNIADAIGFRSALDYLGAIGMEEIRRHEEEILAYALERLRRLPDVLVYGPEDIRHRGGVISFNLDGVHPHDVGTILDRQGIAIRAGHHCNMPLMRRLGVAGTARVSFYLYNRKEEVDALIDGLEAVRRVFRRAAPAPAGGRR